MHDEAVQLKILQTALTLMQSTMLAQNEVYMYLISTIFVECMCTPPPGGIGTDVAVPHGTCH